jgi:formylmethanofuran dehydrogenase subunit D
VSLLVKHVTQAIPVDHVKMKALNTVEGPTVKVKSRIGPSSVLGVLEGRLEKFSKEGDVILQDDRKHVKLVDV